MRGLIKTSVVVVSLILLLPAGTQAQTAATATVSGSVTDPSGAVIPGAEVVLTDKATNLSRSQQTNADGQYVFVNVAPGVYKLTVTMQGFRQAVVPSLKAEVAKSHLVNFTLELGAIAETVEVTAGAAAALQTTDSTVGQTIAGEALLRLPTANRSAAALLLLQPLVTPGRGVDGKAHCASELQDSGRGLVQSRNTRGVRGPARIGAREGGPDSQGLSHPDSGFQAGAPGARQPPGSARSKGNENAAGRMVEERLADRTVPPARDAPALMANHDQIGANVGGKPANLLHRFADSKMAGDLVTAVLQLLHALLQHRLSPFLFLLEQFLGQKTLGEKHARGHAGDGEQMRLGLG